MQLKKIGYDSIRLTIQFSWNPCYLLVTKTCLSIDSENWAFSKKVCPSVCNDDDDDDDDDD